MSSQTETDYDKQFQDDLEKATALSLETLALEEFRRSKLQYSHSDAAVCTNKYAQNPTRMRPGSFNSGMRTSDSQSSIAPPPTVPPRRHSEIRLPSEKNDDIISGGDDLISFTSPTSLKKEDNIHFDKLIEDIQKLNTQVPQQFESNYGFGSSPSLLVSNPQQGMQLVPYNAPSTQKAALTSEQLNQLYNMQPQMPYRNPYQPQIPHFIRSQRAPVTASFNFPPPPAYGFQMHLFPSQMQQQLPPNFSQLEVANQSQQNFTTNLEQMAVAVQAPQQANQYYGSAQQISQIPESASVSSVSALSSVANCAPQTPSPSGSSLANIEVVRRPKKSVGCDDLIDLGHEDNSRVSVLEAFDPLLCKDWDESDTLLANRPVKKVRFC